MNKLRMRGRDAGQALVEFSLAAIVFLVLVMAIVDFGRAIYMYNGVSQAAREMARVTSVHPGVNPTSQATWSSEMTAVFNTQKSMVPGLSTPTIQCLQLDGVTSASCIGGNYVQVQVTAPYRAATPLLGLVGTWTLSSRSLVQIEPQVAS